MKILLLFLTLSALLLVAIGLFRELFPEPLSPQSQRRLKHGLGVNLLLFVCGIAALLYLGIDEVMAASTTPTAREHSIGLGLALIGIGLPTGLATIAAGIAVSSVGAASLAVITERPEVFGRTLIYLGLAEGIAIYGLVVTILLLGKI